MGEKMVHENFIIYGSWCYQVAPPITILFTYNRNDLIVKILTHV